MNRIITIGISFLFLFSIRTSAHEIRPAYLEITEITPHHFRIFWKQPTMGEYSLHLKPILENWLLDSIAVTSYSDSYMIKQWDIQSGQEMLNGKELSIEGLDKTMTDVLVVIHFTNGDEITRLLKPVAPGFEIQQSQHTRVPIGAYLQLGITHILFGVDHLLFVLGLLLLVKGTKRLIKTITAFTIAHSITLALATLHLVQIQQAAAEATIALSIVFLAMELVRHYQGQDGLTYRYPWIVAFVFGLLHGFGFAGALAEVGLPSTSIPIALFLFNVGVELGQLMFVTVALSVIWALKKWGPKFPGWTRFMAPYLIGSLASFWLIERIYLLI
jgi:hydrogenase/urease accessory protein HupE